MVCTNFVRLDSAADSYLVIASLWRGDLVQRDNEDLDVDCESRAANRKRS